MVEKKDITAKRKADIENADILSKPLNGESNPKQRKVEEDPNNGIKHSSEQNSQVFKHALLKSTTSPVLTENFFSLREYLLPKNSSGYRALYVKDIQNLVLYATMGIVSTDKPRWCSISHRQHLLKVFVAVVESAATVDLMEHQVLMPFISSNFHHKYEVVTPNQYSGSTLKELLMVEENGTKYPVTNKSKSEIHFDLNIKGMSDPSLVVNSNRKNQIGRMTKLDLMMTSEEMKIDGYSLPLDNNQKIKDFKYSRKSYRMPTANSPMFAIDCEMISTTAGSEIASICVVDESLKCIYKSYVKSDNEVLDYNTKFSGITCEVLENVTTKLSDVQEHLSEIFPDDVILVGQSLNFDLNVLKVFHPFVIDTSHVYNLSGYKERKSKLKLLAKLFLRRDIQTGFKGHCAQEDAEASMLLVLLKLNKGYIYGNVLQGWMVDDLEDPNFDLQSVVVTTNDNNSKKFKKENRKLIFFRTSSDSQNIFQLAANVGRTSILLGSEEQTPSEDYRTCDSSTLKKCRDVIEWNESFLTVAHLHEVKDSIEGNECSNPKSGNTSCSKCFKRSLKDTDRRLKKVFNSLPCRSLMVILFTGRTNGMASHNGLCFVGVKDEQLLI